MQLRSVRSIYSAYQRRRWVHLECTPHVQCCSLKTKSHKVETDDLQRRLSTVTHSSRNHFKSSLSSTGHKTSSIFFILNCRDLQHSAVVNERRIISVLCHSERVRSRVGCLSNHKPITWLEDVSTINSRS